MADSEWVTITEENEWENIPESVPETGGKFRGAGATGTWEEPTLLSGPIEFGKGLISSELGVAKSLIGTAEAALTMPEEKVRR